MNASNHIQSVSSVVSSGGDSNSVVTLPFESDKIWLHNAPSDSPNKWTVDLSTDFSSGNSLAELCRGPLPLPTDVRDRYILGRMEPGDQEVILDSANRVLTEAHERFFDDIETLQKKKGRKGRGRGFTLVIGVNEKATSASVFVEADMLEMLTELLASELT